MTPEEQRIAIAEACGWARNGSSRNDKYPWVKPVNGVAKSLPDYLNDLNACHEMEKVLDDGGLWNGYGYSLWEVVCPQFEQMSGLNAAVALLLLHATAAQRAEAFLKTLNLYKFQEESK